MFEIHDCKAEIHGIFDYSISLDNPQDHASYFCCRYRKKLHVMQ